MKIFEVGGVPSAGWREYPGTVSAVLDAELSFEVPGRIVEFPVNEGQEVKKGDVLARLDPHDFQAQFDSANALYGDARVDFERAESLFKDDAIVAAGVSRVRPVGMAAATIALGMIPLLPDAFFVAMAVTIIGGLVVATVLTMIVVPVFYAIFFGVRPAPEGSPREETAGSPP